MRRIFFLLIILLFGSCGNTGTDSGGTYISVSIAPFKYFVEEIAREEYTVNIMVPEGADPHIYEPYPEQINRLKKSVGYISNGYLGFEIIWLDRFYEANRTMRRLSLGDKIDPLISGHSPEGDHAEGPDPHYWVSPKCAIIIASAVKEFLCEINPLQKEIYEANCNTLILKIQELDRKAQELFLDEKGKSFLIYHPNLGYLARDYGLNEISLEYEGKEPSPYRMKEIIDRARKDDLRTIFVQREYDTKNAKALAEEIGARLIIIDPLSEEWMESTSGIISALSVSLKKSSK
jgi:zinc transport system substrate-binding protein